VGLAEKILSGLLRAVEAAEERTLKKALERGEISRREYERRRWRGW